MEHLSIETNFTTLDTCIVVVYLLGTIGIGLLVKRFITNMSDYIVAGRALKSHLAIATMIGTELGLVTVMYSAQKGFTGGFAAFHIAVVAGVVTLIVGLTGFIVVPLRRMNVMTIPEFYERRFSPGVRVLGGTILALSGILNMGMFLKAGSLFVTGITGLHSAMYLKLVMTGLLVLVLFYTILGGMVSVVITDYVQFVVLSFSLLVACFFAVQHLGWQNIVDTTVQLQGQAGFDPFHSEGFGIRYVIWMTFMGLGGCAIWQTAVMRACSAVDTKVVKTTYIWSSIGFLIRCLIPYFFGICALVYLSQDAELSHLFTHQDGSPDPQLSLIAMPIFLGRILPVGIIGITTAGMLAAFMSTHDSYLLCWSSVLTQDVVAPCTGNRITTRQRLLLTRIFIFLIGVFLLVWSLWYPLGQDLWDYMAITGALYFAGAFPILLFGIYWKRASRVGAYLALIAGFTAVLGLKPVQNRLGVGWSSASVGLITVGLSVVLMFLGSIFFPDRPPNQVTAQEHSPNKETN